MATVVRFDFSGLQHGMAEIAATLQRTELWLRPLTVELAGMMHNRIHGKGLDSEDRPIGQYSSGYLQQRERAGLGKDKKIILVNTRKLSNSWSPIPTEHGWGVGFTDDGASEGITAMQKIRFQEQRSGRKILDLSPSEHEYINQRLPQIIDQLFK